MGRAWFKVSHDLLIDVLHLPVGTLLERINTELVSGDQAVVVVWHSDIPEMEDKVPQCQPVLRSNVPVEFVEWGVEKTPAKSKAIGVG